MKKPIVPILICAVAVLGTAVTLYLRDTGKPVTEKTATATESVNSRDAAPPPQHPNAPVVAADAEEPEPAPKPRTSGELTDPISTELAYCPGKPLFARMSVDAKQTPELRPNQIGEFPRVYIKPSQKVSISLRFPEAEPGAKASVAVEDGGFISDKKPAAALTLNELREGSFDFTAGSAGGQYRVVVRQGADTRILVLWVEAQS